MPIWAAVNAGKKAGRFEPIPPELGELAIHLSTRLSLLPWVVERVNDGAYALYRAAGESSAKHESSATTEGVSLRVEDKIKFSLLADLDSLLFELNAVCEAMLRFFEDVYAHAGKAMPKKTAGLSMRQVLEDGGEDSSWFVELDRHRNFFIHEGAPYAAIDISRAPDDYDLLILKQNIKVFDDPAKFVRLSEIGNIVKGFDRSRKIVQEHLRNLFA